MSLFATTTGNTFLVAKEQPGEAKHEFTLMKDSAISLNVWCERWLDSGQQRLLEKALKR